MARWAKWIATLKLQTAGSRPVAGAGPGKARDGQAGEGVPHDGRDRELEEKENAADPPQPAQAGADRQRPFDPAAGAGQRDRDQGADEQLGQAGVEHGEELAHARLHPGDVHGSRAARAGRRPRAWTTTSANGEDAQPAQPGALLPSPEPDRQGQGDRGHDPGAQAVGMLRKHRQVAQPAAGVERPVGERPVGERHPGIDAGREGPEGDEHEHPGGPQGGEECQPRFVAGGAAVAGGRRHEERDCPEEDRCCRAQTL